MSVAGETLQRAGAALNPAAFARQRFRAWWKARLPRSDSQLLTQGNVFILPTRAGWMFGVTLLILLVASINYQLNLGYVLTFLLAGSGLVSMHVTHATLRGLTLHLRPPAATFAGTPALLDIVLASRSTPRYGIGLRLHDASDSTLVWTDVAEGASAQARLAFVPARRGVREVPTLRAETRFPLGLFRAWSIWRPASSLVVYPAPESPAPPLPPTQPVAAAPATTPQRSEGGEVEGVRAYRRGDAMQHIAWKKSAQSTASGGELVSRDTRSSARRELWLELSAAGGLDVESRLSRLAAWVVAADRAGIAWGLRLPGAEIEPAEGAEQRRRCLEALALHPPLPRGGASG